jgi:hypothetical protein
MKRTTRPSWHHSVGAWALTASMTAACQSTDRGELRPPAASETPGADAGRLPAEGAGETATPTTSEQPPAVASLEPGSSIGEQTGASCGKDAGACTPDVGTGESACVPTGSRDCTSDLDNDCDGLPDNVLDEVCRCVPGAFEACDDHPGFDGLGVCKPGSRTCIVTADAGAGSSDWGACEGSVGPGAQDSCTVAGDDTDCDGAPNSGCACVDGQTQPCGSTTDTGVCQIGVSTCVNGAFGQCVGAVAPAARDTCAPGDDSNCDGIANEGCTCVDGQTQACGSTTDTGPCQIGTSACVNGVFGQCAGAVAPAARDTCAPGDDSNCNGMANEGCTCINGDVRSCGTTDVGTCSLGSQTCTNGGFGACQGAVGPGPRNCGSSQDNDCDGRPDNTIDNVCECSPGGGNGPCSGDPNNARCNGQGQCVPCQSNTDCQLVANGRNTCDAGSCVAPPLVALGQPCQRADECASPAGTTPTCELFYADADGDGFSPSLASEQRLCANNSFLPPFQTRKEPLDLTNRDCNDDNSRVHPGQEAFFSEAIAGVSATSVAAYDYNCDGDAEYQYRDDHTRSFSPGGFPTCNFAPFDVCNGGKIYRESLIDGQQVVVTTCGQATFVETCGAISPQESFPNQGCVGGASIEPDVVACR